MPKLLRLQRLKYNVMQKEIADAIGVSRVAYCSWESETRHHEPTLKNKRAIIKFFKRLDKNFSYTENDLMKIGPVILGEPVMGNLVPPDSPIQPNLGMIPPEVLILLANMPDEGLTYMEKLILLIRKNRVKSKKEVPP